MDSLIPNPTPENPADARHEKVASLMVNMYEILTDPVFQRVSPISTHEQSRFKPRVSKATDDKAKCFYHILNIDYPVVPPNLARRFQDLGIKFLLRTAQVCIREKNPDEAEKHTKDAIEVAKSIPDDILVARCQFWLGRVEFLRENFKQAHAHFAAAQNSVMDDTCIEGEEVRLYMDITRHGISDEGRARRLEDYKRAFDAGVRYDPSSNNSVSLKSRKRKRPIRTWKSILEDPERGIELPVILSEPLRGKISPIYDGLQPQAPKSTDVHSRAELTQGPTEKITQCTNSPSVSASVPALTPVLAPNPVPKKPSPTSSMETVVVNNVEASRPYQFGTPVEPSQIKKFKFGCVHIGLSKRSRQMKIFPRQPGEIVMSECDWKSIEKRARTDIVTMDYLRREMEGLAMVVEEM
ncbi:hypothetical protein N7499_011074 [Penicillium canescens]|nr:hypothetical protein N7522_010733 [Penicillium canescens]KAJ6069187.1 hypothetical protein N7499_011074 [Penicillium canescens]KAJ6182763.1 hypothetical protein N7485_001405 [Penicillium canescens]